MVQVQTAKVRTARDPERTRRRLLDAAFQEVYLHGFQSADLDTVLERAGVTKGALYYHFENKEALGYAIVEDVVAEMTREKWLRPLQKGDPIKVLVHIVESTGTELADIRSGCPFNNLAQEMSPLDEGFRKRLAGILAEWRAGIAQALAEGQKRGTVRRGIEPSEEATFFIAMYEGYISLAKNTHDSRLLLNGKKRMVRYLESLRA